MKDPVEVEEIVADAGLDVGDTATIGMHVKTRPSSFASSPKENWRVLI